MSLFIIPLFFLAIIVSFYIPGQVLLFFVKKKFSPSEKFFLSWPLGVSAFLLVSYLFGWIQFQFGTVFFLAGALCYWIYKRKVISLNIPKLDFWSISILLLGSLSFFGVTMLSGAQAGGKVVFYDVNQIDGLVHLALIRNMMLSFPPMNPSLAGGILRGYHYFYDFLLSRFALFYGFSPLDLEFRFFPAFIAILYGMSFWLVSTMLTKKIWAIRFILFFAYFGENAGFFYTFFTAHKWWVDIGFPFTPHLLFDPSVIISVPLLLSGVFLLGSKNKTYITAIFTAILFGILSEVKVYAGLIGICLIVLYFFYSFFNNKKQWKWFVIAIFGTGVLTVLTFFPNNYGAGALVFAPLLSYNHFISQDAFANLKWQEIYQIYLAHHNWLRIIQMYVQAMLVFWLVILGLRSIVVLYFGRLFKKSFWRNEKYVLVFLLFSICFVFGSFTIQTVSVFDIMQFFWIGVALFALPTGIVCADLLQKFSIPFKIVFMIGIIAFSMVPLGISYYLTYTFSIADSYTPEEVAFFQSVSNNVPRQNFIVVIPPYLSSHLLSTQDLQWLREPLVAAMTGRSTYYEPAIAYYHIYSSLYATRQQDIYDLAKDLEACGTSKVAKLMQKIGTHYLVSFTDYPCIRESEGTSKSFSTNGVYFYQFR